MRNHRALILFLAAALPAAHAPAVAAQSNCQTFKSLTQAVIIVDSTSLPPSLADYWQTYPYAWGGKVFASIGKTGVNGTLSAEPLGGWFYGRDAATNSIYGKWNGRGKDGFYMFVFGAYDQQTGWTITDSFTLQMGQAVWTPNPGGLGTGYYHAAGELVDGTGRFAGAHGSFTLQGDFVYFSDAFSAWQPELDGKFCM